jgi:hypothetical protein
MVSDETIQWVNENRETLRQIVKHGDPAIRPTAAAFLALVPPSGKETTKINDRQGYP